MLRGEIEDADGSLDGDEGKTEDVLEVAGLWIGVDVDRGALPEGATNEFALDLGLRGRLSFSAPATDFECVFFEVGEEDDGSFVGWDYFKDELQKFALEELRVADGVDDVADSEECGEIAGHASDLDSKGGEARRWRNSCGLRGWTGRKVGCASSWGVCDFAFVHEEDEVGVADADVVAVLEGSAQDGHSVDEGAASAVEVDQLIVAVQFPNFLNGAVCPRDRRIGEADLVCFESANRDWAVDQLSNDSGQRTRDGEEPRFHRASLERECS